MVAARAVGIEFPERARPVRHVFVVRERFVEELIAAARLRQKFKPHDVPDERVRLVDIGIEPFLNTVRAELIEQDRPEFRIRFRRGRLKEEREILADFGSVALLNFERSVLFANRVVDEEFAVERLLADFRAHLLRFHTPFEDAVKLARRVENKSVKHIVRVVYVLNKVVRGRPLDEDPARQFFEQTVGILIFRQEIEQLDDLVAKRFDRRLIRRTARIFLKLRNEPHRPRGNKDAVVMVGGIAHGQHAVGQAFKRFGKLVVFKEDLFDVGRSGQVERDARGKEAVAQPSGALAVRAVGERVD